MRLVVTLGGTDVEITQPGSGGAYPYLAQVGTLLLAARAGHAEGVGVGESANMTVELDNTDKRAAGLLGYCVRAPAQLFDDDDESFFSGLIQSITWGSTMTLSIEA